MEEDVGEQFDGAGVVGGEEGGVEVGFLFGGAGVQVAAHALHAVDDAVGVAFFRPLEDGVFHEMGESRVLGGLVAGAGVDEDAEMGNRGGGGDVEQPETVTQSYNTVRHGSTVMVWIVFIISSL